MFSVVVKVRLMKGIEISRKRGVGLGMSVG